jgi:uncharacterized protein HemX
MQFDIGSLIALIGLILTILGGVYTFGKMSNRLETVEKDLDELQNHNETQHRELYDSRNNMRDILTKLTTLQEGMDKKQDSMEKKIDLLLTRNGASGG